MTITELELCGFKDDQCYSAQDQKAKYHPIKFPLTQTKACKTVSNE